jgi:hypothetical protein
VSKVTFTHKEERKEGRKEERTMDGVSKKGPHNVK